MATSISDSLGRAVKGLEDAEHSVHTALSALDGISDKLFNECVPIHINLNDALSRVTRARDAVDGAL